MPYKRKEAKDRIPDGSRKRIIKREERDFLRKICIVPCPGWDESYYISCTWTWNEMVEWHH